MKLDIRITAGIAAALLIISFTFYVASNATPSWSTLNTSSSSFSFTIGLWMSCTTSSIISTCTSFQCPSSNDSTNFCSKIQAAAAFITIACILSGIAAIGFIVCAVLVHKLPHNVMRILLVVLKIVASVCVAMGLIGVVIGCNAALNYPFNSQYSLGPGAIVGIIGLIINGFGAVVAMFVQPQTSTA